MDINMEITAPIVLYDNRCYLCIKFAKIVNTLCRSKVLLVGHYSQKGKEIRDAFLDSSALEMFWYIDDKTAYGGRAALFPLVKSIMSKGCRYNNDISYGEISCKTPKAVFIRSASLLTSSKKINISR